MASTMVTFAVFLFAICFIESLNAAATGTRNVREVEDAKVPEASGIKPRGAGADSFNIAEFFKELKTKANIAKIFGGLILKSQGGDSPLKL